PKLFEDDGILSPSKPSHIKFRKSTTPDAIVRLSIYKGSSDMIGYRTNCHT
ncbi:hypothetical protein ACJX0J_030636, partial [Zea mays]